MPRPLCCTSAQARCGERALVEADARGGREVQRLRTAEDRQPQRAIGQPQRVLLEPVRLVAEQPGGRRREDPLGPRGEQVVALHIRRDDLESRRAGALDDVGEVAAHGDRQVEQRPGRGAHHLRVVQVDGAPGEHDRVGAGGVGGADDRAEVAGIPHLLADRDQPGVRREDVAHRRRGLPGNGHHALRGDGVGHRGEHELGDVLDAHVGRGRRGAQIRVLVPGGRRREQLDDRVGPVRERLAHRLRSLQQEQAGLGAGAPLGELGDGAHARGSGVLQHAPSLGNAKGRRLQKATPFRGTTGRCPSTGSGTGEVLTRPTWAR